MCLFVCEGLVICFQAKEFGNIPQENWEYDDYRKHHPDLPSPEKEPEDWEEEFSKKRSHYSSEHVTVGVLRSKFSTKVMK